MSLKRRSLIVMGSSLLVYVASFVNQLLIAKKFGVGLRLDTYFAATNIPLALSNLIAACFGYAVVPSLVRDCLDRPNRKQLLSGLFASLCVLAVLISLFGAATIPIFSSYWNQFGEFSGEAKWTSAIAWITAGLFCLIAVSDALYNATERFQIPVLAYIPAYALTAVACLVWGDSYGGIALALATFVGYLLIFPKRAVDQARDLSGPISFEFARQVSKQVPMMLLAITTLYAFPVVDALIGPKLGSGIVSLLGFSSRLIATLGVIIAIGPFGVAIPRLSALSRDGDKLAFAETSLKYLKLAQVALILVIAWMLSNRLAIVQILFERGRFDSQSTQRLSELLTLTIPGAFFMISSMLIVRIIAADGRLTDAAKVGFWGLATYGISLWLFRGFGPFGAGIANCLAWLVYFSTTLTAFLKPFSNMVEFKSLVTFGLKVVVVACATWGGSATIVSLLSGQTWLALCLSGLTALFIYVAMSKLVGLEETRVLLGPVLSRLSRSRSSTNSPNSSQ